MHTCASLRKLDRKKGNLGVKGVYLGFYYDWVFLWWPAAVIVSFISGRIQWYRNRKHFVNTRNAHNIKTLLLSAGGHQGSRKAHQAGNHIWKFWKSHQKGQNVVGNIAVSYVPRRCHCDTHASIFWCPYGILWFHKMLLYHGRTMSKHRMGMSLQCRHISVMTFIITDTSTFCSTANLLWNWNDLCNI